MRARHHGHGGAAWIINTALATNPYIRVHAPSGTLALAKHGPTLASAVDVSGSTRVSTAPVDAPDVVTFEAKWAGVMASAPTRAEPLELERPLERANNVFFAAAASIGRSREAGEA